MALKIACVLQEMVDYSSSSDTDSESGVLNSGNSHNLANGQVKVNPSIPRAGREEEYQRI